MGTDHLWNDGKQNARPYSRIAELMNAASQREARAQEAEAQRQAEEERQRLEQSLKPQERLCRKCGSMTTSPCQP